MGYTVIDEDNHRIDVSEVRYDQPIKVSERISIRERANKRIDICEGTVIDTSTDDDISFMPLHKVLQEISDFL